MAFTPGTITGTFADGQGTRRSGGRVLVHPSVDVIRDTTGKVVMRGSVSVDVANDGTFSIALPPTDDATLDPTGFTYTITPPKEYGPAVSGVALPGGSSRDYADLVSTTPADPTYQPGDVTHGEFNGLAGRVTANEAQLAGRLSDATLSATFVGAIMPELFGAPTSYSTGHDDTAHVQAALDAASAFGAEIYLRRVYNVPAGGLTHTGRVTIRGAGGALSGDPVNSTSPTARAGIRCASGTAVALTLTNAAGSVLRDFAVVNEVSAAPTAGTGIKFVGDGGTSQSSIRGVTILAFYDLMETSGLFFTVADCRFYDSVRYGLYLNNSGTAYADHGDIGVTNNVFAQNYKTWQGGSALRWRAGGGIRVLGNKFLGGAAVGNASAGHYDYCLDFMAADNVSTGDLNITGNSISNMSIAAIRVGLENSGGTAGGFINVSIGDNLINVGFSTAKAILVGAPTAALKNNIRCVHIADNIIDNLPGGGIFAYNLKGITVGINTWQNMPTAAPLVSIADSPDDGTGVEHADIARQNARATGGYDVMVDKRRLNNSLGMTGHITAHEWTQNLYANVVGTWVSLGYVDLPAVNGGTADLELVLTGYDFGVGPMYARYRRVLTKASGNNTVAVVADGTDLTAGAGSHYAVQFVTTTQNRCEVQVQLTTGSATIWGKARLAFRGDIEKSHRGA